MSTKRLARTVVEGGRVGFNQYERRKSSRDERHDVRRILHALRLDPSGWDELAFEPREPVWKAFDDNLGAAQRWLRSRCGKPWREVEGEILRRFDTRSLAGRHIVFCHLLPRESRWSNPQRWRVSHGWFSVDADGRLAYDGRRRRRARWWWNARDRCRCATRFAGRRLVAWRGRVPFWLEPTRTAQRIERKACLPCSLPSAPDGLPRRQAHSLTTDEQAAYAALCEVGRQSITVRFV